MGFVERLRMFEGAGLKLLFIIHHENSVLIVVIGPEAGVGFGHLTAPCLFTQSYQTEARFRGFSTASTPPACAATEWRRSRNAVGVAVPGFVKSFLPAIQSLS